MSILHLSMPILLCPHPVPGVIVEVPLATVGVPCIGGVVPTAQGAAVVADCVAVVAGTGHAVRVSGKAKARQGEAHHGAQLLPETFSWGKPLEMNYKDLRKSVQSVPLGAFPSRLASFTTLTVMNQILLALTGAQEMQIFVRLSVW